MAEKAEKKAEAAAPAAAGPEAAGGHGDAKPKAKGGLLTKLPVLLGGVMLIEGAVLFAGFKMFGAKAASADAAALATDGPGTLGDKGTGKKAKTVELPVGDYKALNRANGRTFLYDISIYVAVKADNQQKVTDSFNDAKALIEDRIRTIIAESDPDKLGGGSEPGLETLRRQIKYQLDRIVGDGIIDEVLIPRCLPFRTD